MGTGAWLMRQRSLFSNEFGSPKFSPQEFQSLFIEAVRNRDNVQWFKQLGEREQDTRLAAFLYLATRDVKVENNRIYLRSPDAVVAATRLRVLDRGASIDRLTLTYQQKVELSSILGREPPFPPSRPRSQPRVNVPRRAGERGGRRRAPEQPVRRASLSNVRVRLSSFNYNNVFMLIGRRLATSQRIGNMFLNKGQIVEQDTGPLTPFSCDLRIRVRYRLADGSTTEGTVVLSAIRGAMSEGVRSALLAGDYSTAEALLKREVRRKFEDQLFIQELLRRVRESSGRQDVVGVEAVGVVDAVDTLSTALDAAEEVMRERSEREEPPLLSPATSRNEVDAALNKMYFLFRRRYG